ncbi:hypothetical protein BH10BAC4_BH10BAC4_22820 [soil metagenome]
MFITEHFGSFVHLCAKLCPFVPFTGRTLFEIRSSKEMMDYETDIKTKKQFDAVKYTRERRERKLAS